MRAVVGEQVVEADPGLGQGVAQAPHGHAEAVGDAFEGGAAVDQQFADQLAHLADQVGVAAGWIDAAPQRIDRQAHRRPIVSQFIHGVFSCYP
ncbi:hypothetical protein D3C85_1637000 [compost metagenome]